MQRVNFKILINASPSRIWNILWADKTYRQWTSVFDPGSYAETDWKEGSSVRFLSGSGQMGMYSVIERAIPEKFMSFKHMGEIRDGKELPVDPAASWTGSMENYTLTPTDKQTELSVDVDIVDQYREKFDHDFPIALQMVKTLAEK